MKTIIPLKFVSIVLVLLSITLGSFCQDQKPNLVLIVSDDQGYADLYANLPDELKGKPEYEGVKLATPNLSLLAESGVIFTDAHTAANTCAPSRAGIMTGRYPQRFGFWDTSDSRMGLRTDETTLADVLKDGGYTNGIIGKWHLGSRYGCHPLQRGFDYFYGFLGHGGHDYYDLSASDAPIEASDMMLNYEVVNQSSDTYITDHISDSTVAFIERNKDNPFFAYVCFTAVHAPWQGPKTGSFAVSPKASEREHYMGMLGRMDLGVKKIINTLEENGLRENTLVVFMSDNGGTPVADNSPLNGTKHSNWEGGNRVPFIMSMPGTLESGVKFNEMIIGFDIFPTFVSLAETSMPDNGKIYDGVNIWPYLNKKGKPASKHGALHDLLIWDQNEKENYDWSVPIETFTWENTDKNIDNGIRKGDLKLRVDKGNITMYNLANDIGETNNVIDRYSTAFEEMKTSYNAWHEQMPPQLEAVKEIQGGCLDPRFEEYESDLSSATRHSDSNCRTLIHKTGCRDPKAVNFDFTVTDHDQSMCKYGDDLTTPVEPIEPLDPDFPLVKPNVIMIIFDDLRDHESFTPFEVQTPNFDRLAERGMKFDRAYCQLPVCNSSRASFLSGLRPPTTRVIQNTKVDYKLSKDVVTLPQKLRDNGYYTISIGKVFHNNAGDGRSWDKDMENDPGYKDPIDYQTNKEMYADDPNLIFLNEKSREYLYKGPEDLESYGYTDNRIAEDVEEFLDKAAGGSKPFFLAAGFKKPHNPYIGPSSYFDLYPPKTLPLISEPEDLIEPYYWATPPSHRDEFDAMDAYHRKLFMSAYSAVTTFSDNQMGRLLDKMDEYNLWDNTIVVCFGDHGYHLGEHNNHWGKVTLYELSARVPMIFYVPGMKNAGQRTKGVVEMVDIFPTLADFIGITPPENLEGESFKPLLDDPSRQWDNEAFIYEGNDVDNLHYSIVTDRYRYTVWADHDPVRYELYDHSKDPGEYYNLIKDMSLEEIKHSNYADVVTEMEDRRANPSNPKSL